MKKSRSHRRRSQASAPAVIEPLEQRALLTSVVQAVQIDNQAPEILGELNGQALLFLEDADSTRLFVSDGTQAETTEIADLAVEINRDVSSQLLGTELFFAATGADGNELWKTNGTGPGTMQVADLNPGAAGSDPDNLTVFNNELFFAATTAVDGREIFKSDGTAAGTILAVNGIPGTNGLGPTELIVYDSHLFFSSTVTLDLHRTDGTTAGTSVVLESNMRTMPYGDRYTDVGSFAVTKLNEKLIAHRVNGDGLRFGTNTKELVAFDSALDSTPTVLFSLQDHAHGTDNFEEYDSALVFVNFRNLGSRLLFQTQSWFGPRRRDFKNPPWNDLRETDGTPEGTLTADRFMTRTPVADPVIFPGEVHDGVLFTPRMDEWPQNGRPPFVVYGVDGLSGHATVGENAYFLGGTGATQSLRRVNVDNDGLQLVDVNISHAHSLTALLGELYFVAPAANGTALYTLDTTPLTPGPSFTAPAANDDLPHGEFEFQWGAVANATSYDLKIVDSTATEETVFVEANQLNTMSHSVLLTTGNFSARVRARFGDGSTSAWTAVDFTVQRPAAPQVIAPASQTSEAKPVIEWTEVAGANHYELWLSRITDGQSQTIAILKNIPDPMVEVPFNLQHGNTYRVWVRAFFANGTSSAWSTSHDFIVATGFRNPVVSTTNPFQETLTPTIIWQAPPVTGTQVTRYEIYINPEGDRSTVSYRRTQLSGTVTSHTVETPLAEGNYEVWVRAHFDDGTKTLWGRSGRPMTIDVPSNGPIVIAPEGFSNTLRPVFAWSAVDNAFTYRLWVARAESPTVSLIDADNLLSTTFTPSRDLPIGNLVAWVRATRDNGSLTDWSLPHRFTILAQLLDPVTFTGGTGDQADTTPTLEWADYGADARIEIYINPVGDRNTIAYHRTDLTGTSHELETALPNDARYEAWIRVHLPHGITRWGDPALLNIGNPAVPFTDLVPVLSVTGNTASWPAINEAQTYELWVNEVDGNGNLVQSRVFHDTSITSTSQNTGLAAGTYRAWLRAVDGNGVKTKWSAAVNFTVAATTSSESLLQKTEKETLLAVLPQLNSNVETSAPSNARRAQTDREVVANGHGAPETPQEEETWHHSVQEQDNDDIAIVMSEFTEFGWLPAN